MYDLYDQLLASGVKFQQKFTADPLPLDPNVPSNLLQDLVFKQFMYKLQPRYEEQLRRMGMKDEKDFTCACYFDEVGNIPEKGEVLSWAESSAVVYANSVLGARCNRNSGIIDVMGSMLGYVPYFGLLTDEGRKATWVVEVKTTKKPEAQLLGSAIGMKVMEDVPYIRGLDAWLGTELNKDNKAYLKDFGAATASNGAVGLYHIEHLTPEAVEQGDALIAPGAQVYVVDDAELERVKASYPVIWKTRTRSRSSPSSAARISRWISSLTGRRSSRKVSRHRAATSSPCPRCSPPRRRCSKSSTKAPMPTGSRRRARF